MVLKNWILTKTLLPTLKIRCGKILYISKYHSYFNSEGTLQFIKIDSKVVGSERNIMFRVYQNIWIIALISKE